MAKSGQKRPRAVQQNSLFNTSAASNCIALEVVASQCRGGSNLARAIGATRFLALTAWRLGEVLRFALGPSRFEPARCFAPGQQDWHSSRVLSHTACHMLRGSTHSGDRLFPAARGNGPMSGFPKRWKKIVKLGKLPAETAHVFGAVLARLRTPVIRKLQSVHCSGTGGARLHLDGIHPRR